MSEVLGVLGEAECLELLRGADVGRVAFNTATGPRIYPVNFVVDNGTIVIRTSPYTALGEHATGTLAFEVDDLEPSLRQGWSVLVVGQAAPVDDADETIALSHQGKLEAWAPGQRNMFVRITPREITGRRIHRR